MAAFKAALYKTKHRGSSDEAGSSLMLRNQVWKNILYSLYTPLKDAAVQKLIQSAALMAASPLVTASEMCPLWLRRMNVAC